MSSVMKYFPPPNSARRSAVFGTGLLSSFETPFPVILKSPQMLMLCNSYSWSCPVSAVLSASNSNRSSSFLTFWRNAYGTGLEILGLRWGVYEDGHSSALYKYRQTLRKTRRGSVSTRYLLVVVALSRTISDQSSWISFNQSVPTKEGPFTTISIFRV